jgi:thioredoxin-dependent peroxiredoxin
MSFLKEGDIAPEFALPRSGGGTLSLSELRGQNVVMYFYPADDTPGCTKQACGLRDIHPRITQANAIVLGISPDDVTSHDRFAAKYGLPFILLADVDHKVAETYGAWTERNVYGKKFMGIQRSTYLVDPEGKIKRVWEKVKADEHAGQVLGALRATTSA